MADEEARQCRFCDLVWGTLGVTAGVVLLYMGLDLLTSGGISRMISGNYKVPITTTSKGSVTDA
jgi:hypothetical protein